MDESEVRREYLRLELARLNVDWKDVSVNLLSRSHSYIQQHIQYGTPRYLGEADREAIVKEYGLDRDRLRPPPKARKSTPSPSRPDALLDRGQSHLGSYTGEEFERLRLIQVWGAVANRRLRSAILELAEAAAEAASDKLSGSNDLAHQETPPEQTTEPEERRE